MAEHNELGKKGEELAAEYLLGKEYEIIEQNWRTGKDEIDIIAKHNNFLVIVEVKTRSTDYFGDPSEAVTDIKQKFLIRAADEYVNQKEIDLEIRYDIISIILKSNQYQIQHIEDAFYASHQE
jgi:putative endonuclease